ncbi:putative Translocon-associated protein subunit alpha [Hypsibius exemplaris]|uniref:Translocon-associated protein subunit alpha n=1 Tax=Hypsibius exemplaris TaxID=2072580 RepID=A0A1W0WPL4_HYPEX|nr:putative Translocon-associated protein subunit alpha [Hypsibius exemplaris]
MFRPVVFLSLFLLAGFATLSRAEEDVIIETAEETAGKADGVLQGAATDATAEEAAAPILHSPDAETTVYFTFPPNTKEIPTNKPIRLLIGFRNKGEGVFMVDYLDASLRYPMDFSYNIANLTSVRFSRAVAPREEATFDYGFYLSDAFASRPFTLNINLHYRDATDKGFIHSIYNETIQAIEVDEGLDSQTFFLYVIFGAIVVLGGVFGQQYFAAKINKKRPARKAEKSPAVESGTSKSSDVDYDWLPESSIRHLTKSPKKSPTQTPSPQQSPKAKKRV